MKAILSNARVIPAVFGAMFGLFTVACEKEVNEDSAHNATSSTVPVSAITNSAVLNDDPRCELVIKYRSRNLPNEGQVHYVNRVLVSEPFDSAFPVCVQYNDTRAGEVTLWKDLSNRSTRIDTLPSDRGIDKIVVWYE